MPMDGMTFIAAARAAVETCDPSEAARRVREERELVVIDVREQAEHAGGAVVGATNIPRGMLEFQIATACPRPEAGILVYCKSGGRAVLAAKTLGEMGYANVIAVEGPVDELIAALS